MKPTSMPVWPSAISSAVKQIDDYIYDAHFPSCYRRKIRYGHMVPNERNSIVYKCMVSRRSS